MIVWAVIAVGFGTIFWYSFIMQNIERPTTPLESGLYISLSRVFWAVLLSMMVFMCAKGYGGIVNKFLASPYWLPMVRSSYALYIIHMPVLLVFTASSRKSFYFTETAVVSLLIFDYNSLFDSPDFLFVSWSFIDSGVILLFRWSSVWLQCLHSNRQSSFWRDSSLAVDRDENKHQEIVHLRRKIWLVRQWRWPPHRACLNWNTLRIFSRYKKWSFI